MSRKVCPYCDDYKDVIKKDNFYRCLDCNGLFDDLFSEQPLPEDYIENDKDA